MSSSPSIGKGSQRSFTAPQTDEARRRPAGSLRQPETLSPSQARGSEEWGANPPIVKRPHSLLQSSDDPAPILRTGGRAHHRLRGQEAVSSQFQKPDCKQVARERCLARIMHEFSAAGPGSSALLRYPPSGSSTECTTMTAGPSGVKPCQSGASGPSLRKRVNYPG